MLILARKVDERIIIGGEIEISVVDIRGDQVKLGINAPSHVKVYRQEVYEAILAENRQAVSARNIPAELGDLFKPGQSPRAGGNSGESEGAHHENPAKPPKG
ncbi:MAG: carbon storage regulator [Spirochaetaceae bacterium]|nr:MAG: carbon storage regulator [Spirochaetaceae bacterium]